MLEVPDDHPDKLLHRDVTEKIIGGAFKVYKELGYGFLERVYERSLQAELIKPWIIRREFDGDRNKSRPSRQFRTIKGRVQTPRLFIRVSSVSICG